MGNCVTGEIRSLCEAVHKHAVSGTAPGGWSRLIGSLTTMTRRDNWYKTDCRRIQLTLKNKSQGQLHASITMAPNNVGIKAMEIYVPHQVRPARLTRRKLTNSASTKPYSSNTKASRRVNTPSDWVSSA